MDDADKVMALEEEVRVLRECLALSGQMVLSLLNSYSKMSGEVYRLKNQERLVSEYLKMRGGSS